MPPADRRRPRKRREAGWEYKETYLPTLDDQEGAKSPPR
nr:MAG TPA: hypothetical protein [Caudoviricetes sp.]